MRGLLEPTCEYGVITMLVTEKHTIERFFPIVQMGGASIE